jgi:dihydrodipicolinate synthase/N-acetylneuraminate lyase
LLARYAAEQGAHSVVTAAPFVLPQGRQRDLRAYLEHLAAAVPLPLFLYNMPPLTKTHFDLETISFAMNQPRLAGLKDSSGDLDYFRQVCAWLPARPDWTLLSGPEELLPETIAMGGHGGIPGGANLFPQLYVALYQAAREGHAARLKTLHSAVMQVSHRLYHLDGHVSGVIKGIKCALSCLGICRGLMSEPFQPLAEPIKEQVQSALDELQPLIQNALQTPATIVD